MEVHCHSHFPTNIFKSLLDRVTAADIAMKALGAFRVTTFSAMKCQTLQLRQ